MEKTNSVFRKAAGRLAARGSARPLAKTKAELRREKLRKYGKHLMTETRYWKLIE